MEQEIIYPRPLRAGDRVCLIDPANARTPEAVQKMTEYLEGKELPGLKNIPEK